MRITLRNGNMILEFSKKPAVMGVINCTPDSFYGESRARSETEAIESARQMIRDGADILDIGGESTRPGSDFVNLEEEAARILPVIRAIRKESDIPISVDTRKAPVAEKALDAGADIVNDISALEDDPALADLVARRGVPVVLMHKRGTPKVMQQDPYYLHPVEEILAELKARIENARERGVKPEQIIIDPGIGFGKRLEDNLAVMKNLRLFADLGYPLLVGASRKSSIGAILREGEKIRGVEGRLSGTLAAHVWAVLNGAHIIRVHDVKEHTDAVKVISAIRNM